MSRKRHPQNERIPKTGAGQSKGASKRGLQPLPSVSVCTVTQNRNHLLPLLEQCILAQTYPHELIQWIVVDDSDPSHPRFIPSHSSSVKTKVVHLDQRIPLGKKRNISHQSCEGDIIVYMDDDEYYPPRRIEHAVESLEASGKEVAGTTNLPILFLPECEIWMAGPFGKDHATANTFAFRRSLLEKTKYEDSATHAEEKEFLKNFSIPMVQLDPKETLVCFGHATNTFDKRRMIGQGNNPRMRKMDSSTISDWIGIELLDRYILAHKLSNGRKKPLTSTSGTSAPGSKDLNLILLCSPPGSGEVLIQEVLRKLGTLIISGENEAQGAISPKLLDSKTLKYRQTPAMIRQLLSVFRDELVEFRQQTAAQPLLLRDPYVAPLMGELREALGMRLIICLRPITELTNVKTSINPIATIDASIIHQIYGHLFSAITNSDIPFIIVRYSDIKTNSKQTVNTLARFCGLNPSHSQLDDAAQWMAAQCNSESQ